MKPLPLTLTLLAACGFLVQPASAAPQAKVREKATLSISFLLQESAVEGDTTVSSGTATLDATRKNGVETGTVNITVTGLAAGNYTVEGAKVDGTSVELGSVTVAASADPAVATVGSLDSVMPAGVNVLDVESISIVDGTDAEVLSGVADATTTLWKYFANVPVTAPVVEPVVTEEPVKGNGGAPKVKKVNGHVVAKSTIKDDEETKRQFLFVAKGAPANTTLTIVVDGEEIDEVVSTAQGKVMFNQDLIGDVVIQTIHNLSLVDENGVVVMVANF
ncbi:MAG TPA: hypothetical protein VF614_08170 [Chthoniobacteraceae bacterium]|jgi:hypothetical protein